MLASRRQALPLGFPRGLILAAAVCLPLASAQPQLNTITAARETYSVGMDIWSALQQDLQEAIKSLPRDAALTRLQAVEKARLAVSRARTTYLSSLTGNYAAMAEKLKAPVAPAADPSAPVLAGDKEMISDLDAAVALLDEEIRKSAATDRTHAASLQKQKTDLLDLRSLVLRRGRELARLDAGRGASSVQRATLAAAYSKLAVWTATVSELAAAEDNNWSSAYAALRAQLASASSLPPAPVRQQAPPASPTPAPAQPPAAPVVATNAGGALVPNIAGLWALDNPKAKKLPSGAYEPASARIDIRQSGPDVEGTFECTFAVPPGEKYNPVVRFNFSGSITNPILRFNLTPPLTGYILIRQGEAGTLEVSYGISNPQRTGIDFGAVPDDGPQVLRKALR